MPSFKKSLIVGQFQGNYLKVQSLTIKMSFTLIKMTTRVKLILFYIISRLSNISQVQSVLSTEGPRFLAPEYQIICPPGKEGCYLCKTAHQPIPPAKTDFSFSNIILFVVEVFLFGPRLFPTFKLEFV